MFILISGIAILLLYLFECRFYSTQRRAMLFLVGSIACVKKKRKRKIREKALIFSQTIQAIDILLLSIKEYEGGRISICLLM